MAFSIDRWHEWICHTNFSFLIGASHPWELVGRAAKLGYGGLGIADYDGVYGIARAYRELEALKRDRRDGGLRLYYGAEIHLNKDHDSPLYFQKTLVLYAQTRRGYFNLCRLLTYSHRDGKRYGNVPLEKLLSAPVEDLVAIQPMRGLIRTKEGECRKALHAYFGPLRERFADRFYFAVSRHLHPVEDCWIMPTVRLARYFAAPTIPSQDLFFARRRQKEISDLLHAVRHNKTLDAVSEQLFVNSRRSLHSLPALAKMYADIPGIERALSNSTELALRFDFGLHELRYAYPREMLPVGHTPQSYLEHLVWKKTQERFGPSPPDKLAKLLEHELALVENLGFADYFLTVWDIVSWARRQGILCQGRGSAANSAICYVLEITAINPDRFDLLFERFISVERGDPPDIDVDFENARREEVIQYIYERYGRERAAMVCNVITFKPRGALRFVGKALGVPEPVIDACAKMVYGLSLRGRGIQGKVSRVRQLFAQEKEINAAMGHKWDLWPALSERILGFPRFLGIHSGGFMLAEREIDRLLPQEPATKEGRTVIQWCKEDIEALGFFKIDILALGMLTAMRKCFDLIRQHYGRSLALATIPENDPDTYEMIRRADTTGVFQIESTAQMSSLPVLRPLNFYDLVVQVAIIRPGPILAGVKHPYLRRRYGQEAVSYADPRLEPILKRTYGTIIFQEQLMRVAMAIGNFTAGEADEIRKNIGSFQSNGKVEVWMGKLIREMKKNGIDDNFIREIVQQVQGFSSYGFPESHAASFALLAYASSYLKCHYPAAFFAALLNSQPMGFYQPDTLIKTAKRAGVQVLPVCASRSDWDSALEPAEMPQKEAGRRSESERETDSSGTLREHAIRLGFHMVAGLGKNGALKLIEERESCGGWISKEELFRSGRLSRTDLAALAAANAFRSFPMERRPAVWLAEGAPHRPDRERAELGAFAPPYQKEETPVPFPAESEAESIESDFKATGTSLGRHMVRIVKEQGWVYWLPVEQIVTSDRLGLVAPNSTIAVFGAVLVRQSPGTAHKMLFVTLEDEYGTIPTAIRPNVYARYDRIIDSHSFLCMLGRLQPNGDARSLLVSQVFPPVAKRADVLSLGQKRAYDRLNGGNYRKIRNYM